MNMRLFTVLLATFFVALAGCSSQSTPENVIADYYGYIGAGKFDKAVKLFDLDGKEHSKAEMEVMEGKLGVIMGETKKEMDARQGLKEMKVLSSEFEEDGTLANVSVSLTFRDGSEKTENFTLVKIKNDWKFRLK